MKLKRPKNMIPICTACRARNICEEPDKMQKVSCIDDIYDKWNDLAKSTNSVAEPISYWSWIDKEEK